MHGINGPQTDPHLLQRIVVDVDQHWLMIAAKSSGAWDLLVGLGRIPGMVVKSIFGIRGAAILESSRPER